MRLNSLARLRFGLGKIDLDSVTGIGSFLVEEQL